MTPDHTIEAGLLSTQRYWGVLDILAIDCEATAANRQLAQEYAISGFPTFVLMHKGRKVDQVCSYKLGHSHAITLLVLLQAQG